MHFDTPKMEQHTLTSPITQNESALFFEEYKEKEVKRILLADNNIFSYFCMWKIF